MDCKKKLICQEISGVRPAARLTEFNFCEGRLKISNEGNRPALSLTQVLKSNLTELQNRIF